MRRAYVSRTRPDLSRILGFLLLSGLLGAAAIAIAADHQEAPLTIGDPAADIADVYAWIEDGKLITIVTFDGLKAPERRPRATFDTGVRYTVNIDNDGDFLADEEIHVRFAKNRRGRVRMVVENLPGAPELFVAPVNRRVRLGCGARVFAGIKDDPFFFDLEGFGATLQTGTLMFDNTRDSVAGLNASAIALEMNVDDVLAYDSTINVWATTARR